MKKLLVVICILLVSKLTLAQNVYPTVGDVKIFADYHSWAEGLCIVKPSGWAGIRFARNDPQAGSSGYSGNWAIGYTGYSGDDLSISNHYGSSQYNDIFHISASTRNVGIGTSTPGEKLSVNGKIRAKEIKVEAANWPDYVFTKSYSLLPLAKVEEYIMLNGHLPEVPSAAEVSTNGIALGEMNAKLLKKVEELTLYLIEKDKQLAVERAATAAQEERIQKLEKMMELLIGAGKKE